MKNLHTYRWLIPVASYALLGVLIVSAPMLAQVWLPQNSEDFSLKIEVGESTGSGFLVGDTSELYLVTARHVLFEDSLARALKAATATINGYSAGEPYSLTFDLVALRRDGELKADTAHDVAVIRWAEFLRGTPTRIITHRDYVRHNDDRKPTYGVVKWTDLRKYEQVQVGSDVYVFGYPTSIGLKRIPQIDYDRPLLQKGIVAGLNPAKKTIVLNVAANFGNSGGPAVEVEDGPTGPQFVAIGVVTEYIPFEEVQLNVSRNWVYSTISSSPYSIAEPLDPVIDIIRSWK